MLGFGKWPTLWAFHIKFKPWRWWGSIIQTSGLKRLLPLFLHCYSWRKNQSRIFFTVRSLLRTLSYLSMWEFWWVKLTCLFKKLHSGNSMGAKLENFSEKRTSSFEQKEVFTLNLKVGKRYSMILEPGPKCLSWKWVTCIVAPRFFSEEAVGIGVCSSGRWKLWTLKALHGYKCIQINIVLLQYFVVYH